MSEKPASRKMRRLLLLSVMMLVLLSACSGNRAGTGPQSAEETSGNASEEGQDSGGTLVIGMTAANLPIPDTPPTEGAEGFRFVGFQLYDALVKWELSDSDTLSTLVPGLAKSWEVSEEDPTVWTFHLREGVTFHDGEPFNADAAIFAFDRILNSESPYYSETAAASSRSYVKTIAEYSKIDDYTIQIRTANPDSYLLYGLSSVLFPSPKAVMEAGNDNYKNHPVGTGPFVFVEMVERDRMVMERNPDYWGGAPKLDRLVVRPLAEPATRLSALHSGEVQWAEIPPPDAIPDLEGKGFQVFLNEYPHVWPYVFNLQEEPWSNVLVRQAANYAIDREGMVEHLLHGVASPATGPVYEGHPWYPDDAQVYNYDPEKARELLAEAGYPDGFATKIVIPSSGSGNMWPIEMGEFIQQNLSGVGIEVELEVIEWNTMRTQFRQGFTPGTGAYNYAWTTATPDFVEQFYLSTMMPPQGLNPSGYNNPEVDRLLTEARQTFDESERDALIREAFAYVQNEAPWLFVVHDNNLRIMAPEVRGYTQPQSWYVDLTQVWVE